MVILLYIFRQTNILHPYKKLILDWLVVLFSSIIISLCSPLVIHLPNTPVPIALQPHVILFVAAILGSQRATLAVLLFLVQGAFGLPVFGGKAGIACILGPTGGYILGYVLAAFLVGLIVELSTKKTASIVFVAMVFGNIILYLFGASWLGSFVGTSRAIELGVIPFIPGALLKLIFFATVYKKYKKTSLSSILN